MEVCSACNEPIFGDHILAFNMKWHLDHLVCKVCGKDFADGTQVCEGQDGFAYCPDDWKRAFCPPCHYCKDPIVGPLVNALNKSFHPDHFLCFTCKKPLEGQVYAATNGDPLCELHYYEDRGLICGDANCGKPIQAGKVVTMKIPGGKEVKFHVEHFNCAYCKKNIAGQTFRVNKNKPFCIECYTIFYE